MHGFLLRLPQLASAAEQARDVCQLSFDEKTALSAVSRIIVTGTGGFIGKALCRLLDDTGTDWAALDRSVGIDLAVPQDWAALPTGRAIVHLAGGGSVPAGWNDPYGVFRSNLLTLLGVLEHARRCGAHVVLASSYMYGTPRYLPIDEAHPVAGNNPYAHAKRLSEELAEAFARDFGLPVTILRIFNPYGPEQAPDFLIPTIVRQALAGDTITVDDLAPRRDYLWIDDLAAALRLVAQTPADGLRTFNVGSGKSFSVAEVIEAVTAVTGPRRIECRNRRRENEIPDCICDNRHFAATFGWLPATGFATGIGQTVAAMSAQSGASNPC